MNKLILNIKFTFLICFLSGKIGFGSEIDTLFNMANNAYTGGDYQKSIELYDSLVKLGYSSSELYFNLGNAYYKSNNLPHAILNYERAKLINPKDEAINYNLQLANTFRVDQIEAIPDFFIKKWLTNLTLWQTFENWGLYSIISFFILMICIIIFLFTSKTKLKKFTFILAIVFFIFSLSSFIFAHKRYNLETAKNKAIITSASVTLKSSPDESGTDLFVLHEGTKVIIVDQVGNWYEIKISDGNRGWISKSGLEII